MVERELPALYEVRIPRPLQTNTYSVFTTANLQQFSVSAPQYIVVSIPMSDGYYQLATPVMTLSFSPQHNDARSECMESP